MYEFLALILTGTRIQRLKRFNLIIMILAILEVAVAVSLLFVSHSVHIAVPTVMGVLLVVISIINTAASVKRSSFTNGLIAEQLQSDGLASDELTCARKSLAEKYLTVNTKQKGIYSVILNSPVIFYILSAVFSVLCATGTIESAIIVPILFALGTVSGLVLGVFAASFDNRHRTALYEQADGEIKILKRYAGIDERDIQKQSYTARNTATRTQELFLHDPADRAALRKIANKVAVITVVLLLIYVALINAIAAAESLEVTYITVGASCITATLFAVWTCTVIWAEIRKRAIYRHNEASFSDSEADSMRRFLQNEFVKLQRRGNIFFSAFCGTATLIGIIFGLTGAIDDPEVSLAVNTLSAGVAFFLMSAIVALIIWAIAYAVYRKKVKPVELRLSNMQ